MKRTLTLCLAGLLLLPSQAARRIGEAQVRESANGLPCFTISEREEGRSGTPDFGAITVTEGERILWRMAMPPERTFPVTYSMCVPYGGRVPALPQTPATPLASGIVYTVQIDTRPRPEPLAPLRYGARFCVAAPGKGSRAVHQFGADSRPERDPVGCSGKPGPAPGRATNRSVSPR
jgi:hypothetical protein